MSISSISTWNPYSHTSCQSVSANQGITAGSIDPSGPTSAGTGSTDGTSLASQLQAAIDSALQSSNSSDSSDPATTLDALKDAITQVLSQNGLLPPDGVQGRHHHGGAPGAADPTAAITGGTSDADGDGDGSAASGASATGGASGPVSEADLKKFVFNLLQALLSSPASSTAGSSSADQQPSASGLLLNATA